MSDTKHTPGHGLTPRVIQYAALLAERFQNPDVAAYNRSRGCRGIYIGAPTSERRQQFWFSVGRALGDAYGLHRGCPSDYERAVRRDIDAARAAIAKATGGAQ